MKDGMIVFPAVDLEGDRKLTLAAEVHTLRDDEDDAVGRVATFGYSIKNPSDKENTELAKIIAKGRATKSPVFIFSTAGYDMPRELLNKVATVIQEEFKTRLDYYVPLSKKKDGTSKKIQ